MLCFSEDTLLFAAMLHGSCVHGAEGVLFCCVILPGMLNAGLPIVLQ